MLSFFPFDDLIRVTGSFFLSLSSSHWRTDIFLLFKHVECSIVLSSYVLVGSRMLTKFILSRKRLFLHAMAWFNQFVSVDGTQNAVFEAFIFQNTVRLITAHFPLSVFGRVTSLRPLRELRRLYDAVTISAFSMVSKTQPFPFLTYLSNFLSNYSSAFL